MRSLGRLMGSGVAVAGALALTVGSATSSLAQDPGLAPVVDVHTGTCEQFEPDPTFQLGNLQLIPIEGIAEEGEGVAETVDEDDPRAAIIEVDIIGGDGVFDEEDEGFLADDLDDDGLGDVGVDLNDDGILDENEVLGEDVDGDAALGEGELTIIVPLEPASGMVWKGEENNDEVDGEELVQGGNLVMVIHHSADQYGTYLACGSILDLVEEDMVVIPLREFNNSGYFGLTLFQEDSGEFATYLFQGTSTGPQVGGQTPTPVPTNTPAPTPTPEPTKVVTAVVEADATVTVAVANPNEAAAILGDDGVFDENDEGYLAENIDDDAVWEIGQDRNGDGVLTEDEVLGEDANEDSGLTEDELI